MGLGRRGEPGSAPAIRSRGDGRDRDRARPPEGAITLARPLVRPAPRSAMFFPLVVIVAVLPGLVALASWDLTAPGPWWGLRGLAVLDGFVFDQSAAARAMKPPGEALAFETVASQPPLYAWLESVGLALSSEHNPLASVLPSYAAGALVVVLVYLHGRLWRGPGLGLIAAVLVGFNRHLLVQMQQATPTTLALAGTLGALLCYGEHLRMTLASSSDDLWRWRGPVFWAGLGGLSLGLALMSVGLFGFAAVPVVLLHQAYLRSGSPPGERPGRGHWWAEPYENRSVRAGIFTTTVALAIAAPWHLWMIRAHGFGVVGPWLAPFEVAPFPQPGLLGRLVRLAPATLPLGLFAAVRAIRAALADESDDRSIVGGAFWVVWLAVAALVPTFWPSGPWHLTSLFMLVPLNLLAASAISDLATRRIPIRTLTWLAPATALAVVWLLSANLSNAVVALIHGRADAATALGLHLAFDVLIIAIVLTRTLDRWARRRDDRQRKVLAGFMLAVIAVTVGVGSREVFFQHQETDDLLRLRTMILWSDHEHPFTQVVVVGPDAFRPPKTAPSPAAAFASSYAQPCLISPKLI